MAARLKRCVYGRSTGYYTELEEEEIDSANELVIGKDEGVYEVERIVEMRKNKVSCYTTD